MYNSPIPNTINNLVLVSLEKSIHKGIFSVLLQPHGLANQTTTVIPANSNTYVYGKQADTPTYINKKCKQPVSHPQHFFIKRKSYMKAVVSNQYPYAITPNVSS